MFGRFGRKKKDPQPKAPTYDEEYDDDFGYEREGERGSRKGQRSRDDSLAGRPPWREESLVDRDSEELAAPSAPPRGRGADDATVVPHSPAVTPLPRREEPPPQAEETDLPDATQFLGALPDAGLRVVGWLVSTRGPNRGADFRLGRGRTRLGTSRDCEIHLAGDAYASAAHAEVESDGSGFLLRDLGSTNGTFRNDERIHEVRLEDEDRIRLGTSQFVFKSVRL